MGAILLLLFLRLHIVVRVRIGYYCSLTKKEPLLNGKEEGSASASASSAAALPSSLPMPFMMKTQSGKLAEETDHYSILLDLLKRDLPRETILKILDKYKEKTKSQNSWAESVILTAIMKLDEDDLKMVLGSKIPGADVPGVKNFAIAKIEDRAFLQQYIQTEKSEMQMQVAIKRLQQLEK